MRFLVLGPVEVHNQDGAVAPGRPRQRALLAYLLLSANQVVSTGQLIDALWGGAEPATARAQVQADVSAIRRRLRRAGLGAPIHSRSPGYAMTVDAGQLDLDLFSEQVARASSLPPDDAARTLRGALGLWRGPALADVSAAYVEGARSRLREQRLAAYEALAEAELAAGRHAGLVVELTPLVEAEPLRERLVGQLMLALYRSGRQAEALRVSRNLRSVLVEHEGLDPSRAHLELETAILRGDPALDWSPPAAAVAVAVRGPPPAPAPAQLPADIGDFTGRADAIAQLDAWAADDRAAGGPVLLTGGAGVGKTALAVHWGWRVASQFGDGQLYVDLRGWAAGSPLQPIEALSLFLRALGVAPERVPVDLAEASGLYRTLLAGRRMLVVLDDAAGPEQVRPLLPGGPGNLLVITSRERLSGMVAREGARRLVLGMLEEADALALLARIAGARWVRAEPAAAAQLVRVCAYLPLALRIAAANLTGHPGRRLADLVAELRGDDWPTALDIEGDPEAQVHGAFDLSYAAQEPAARRLFRLLGLVPGPDFTRADAAALAQGPADPSRLLDLLTDANLVDQPVPGRFAFHDLLRRYAVERAEREERRADRDRAVGRLYQRYLAATAEAARLVSPQLLRLPGAAGTGPAAAPCFAGQPEALAWLDAERVNLVAAIHRAAEHGPAEVSWLLVDALRGYFAMRRHMGDWLGVARAALSAAVRAGAEVGQVSARFSLAQALWWLGRHGEAVEQLTQALALARRTGWREAEASCLGNLGGVHGEQGRLREAAAYLAEAIETRRRHGMPEGSAANNLTNLGAVCYDLGRLAEAAEHQTRAMALYGRMGARVGEAQSRANLGQVLLDLGEPAAAAEHLGAAREVLRECGERSSEAAALADLARLQLETGKEGEAARLAELALAAAREAGAGKYEAAALDVLGLVQRSPARHREALQVACAAGVGHTEVWVLLGSAETLAACGRFAEAADHGERALAHARLAGFRALEGAALAVLAEVQAAQGRSAEARELARQVLVVHEETGYDQLRRRALAIAGDGGATGRAAQPDVRRNLR